MEAIFSKEPLFIFLTVVWHSLFLYSYAITLRRLHNLFFSSEKRDFSSSGGKTSVPLQMVTKNTYCKRGIFLVSLITRGLVYEAGSL